ncbi:MAG: type II secretion system F family protein [Nitrospiraceae bacterium]|nr:type II secretion system F family protein [Nitrospiraceae bacterium]
MPLFTYKAMREDGTSVNAEIMAATTADARQQLETRGYLVLEMQKKSAGLGFVGGKANEKDFLLFNQEFMTLIKAGLPILQGLEILHRRMEKPALKTALGGVIEAVKGGTALSDALAANPVLFPPLYTATVRAGEQSGALVDVLKRFIDYQKRMLAIKRKLKTALAYPVFLVVALTAVLLLFFLYIIPNFTQMYSEQGAKLPKLTMMLMAFTHFLTTSAPFLFLAAIGGGVALYSWRRTESGKQAMDALVLRIPFLRSVTIQYVLAQLTRTLATVLRGGIPLMQALETTAGVIANRVIGRRLREVRTLVTEGVSLATAFEQTRLAPDMTVRMIEVGESSGDLPQMLEDVSDFYEQEVENRLTILTTMIEPVLMLVMGIVIAVIVVALYLPIFEMGANIR